MLCPSWCCPLSFSFPFLHICTVSPKLTHILGFVNLLPETLLFYCRYRQQLLLISVLQVRLNGFSINHSLCVSLSGLGWRQWCCSIISIINYDLGKSFNHVLWFMYALTQRTENLFNTILIIPLLRLQTDRLFCITKSEPSQPNMPTDCDVKTVTMTTGTAANGIWYHNLVTEDTSNHGTKCFTHQILDWHAEFQSLRKFYRAFFSEVFNFTL